MKRSTSRATIVALALAGAASFMSAQGSAPDVVLTNGKIITVDDRFSIAQAVAVRGDRILAVGSDAEVG
jgi:adenine deaminase